MQKTLSGWFRKSCSHHETIVVRSSHVKRTICEACGSLSFEMTREDRAGSAQAVRSSALHQEIPDGFFTEGNVDHISPRTVLR